MQSSNQMMMQKGYQVFSQPSSPSKDQVLIDANKKDNPRMGYAVSVIEPNVSETDNMQKPNMNPQMTQSVISGNMSALSGQNGNNNHMKKTKYKNITMD